MIKVVAGVIVRDKKVLIARRKKKNGVEKWEFPGGKIKDNEGPHEALVREIEEELNLRVRALDLISVKELPLESGEKILFYAILARMEAKGEPVATEHEELRWVDFEEIGSFDLFEPDRSILEEIKRFLASLK